MLQTIIKPYEDYRGLDEYFQAIGTKRLFLVCGGSLQKLPIGRYFDDLGSRITVVRFSAFTPNPRYEDAAKAVEQFRASGCDSIAAVGGGSTIDVAKCVKLWRNLDPGKVFLEQAPAPGGFPLLAVPTTAGTGSEATRYAVIYRQGEKQSVSHKDCIPSAVLLDPSTLETLPDYHRKASMLDAFCHGIESFWSIHATKKSREYSGCAIRKILKHREAYLRNEPNGNAGMLEAAHLAGKAINLTQTTAGHAMCYGLTSLYGTAHGHAAALCVSKLWRYMAARAGGTALEDVLRELAIPMGCRSISESIQKFGKILDSLGLEPPRPEPEDFPVLQNSVCLARLKNNPIIPDEDSIQELYHQILSKGGCT